MLRDCQNSEDECNSKLKQEKSAAIDVYHWPLLWASLPLSFGSEPEIVFILQIWPGVKSMMSFFFPSSFMHLSYACDSVRAVKIFNHSSFCSEIMDNKYQNHKHMNITVQSDATFNQKIIELSYLSIGWVVEKRLRWKRKVLLCCKKILRSPSLCVFLSVYWTSCIEMEEESNVLMYGLDLYGFWNI